MDLLDKFIGSLLGAAVGDALGMPLEGFSSLEIQRAFGRVVDMLPAPEHHFHHGLQAGQYTDDTEETLILAESIIEAQGFSGDAFAEHLMRWGSKWILDERLNRGVGITTRSAIENMLSGKPWQDAGVSIETCGAAMRAAPIGLVYHWDLSMVARYSELQSIVTHRSRAARAGAVALAVGVALSLLDLPRMKILEVSTEIASRISPELGRKLEEVQVFLQSDRDPSDALELLGTSPSVHDAVPSAFYCFVRLDPEDALVEAVNAGGDTDSVASMAGALAGARYGTSWIPQRWLSHLENRDRIEEMGRDLGRLSLRLSGRV